MQLGTLPVLAAPSCLVPLKTTTNFEGNARSFKRHGYSSTFPSPRNGLRSIPLILQLLQLSLLVLHKHRHFLWRFCGLGFEWWNILETSWGVRLLGGPHLQFSTNHLLLVRSGESSMIDPHWCLESESNPAKQSKWHWKHSKLKCWSSTLNLPDMFTSCECM